MPILLRRVLLDIAPGSDIRILHPIRVPRSKLLRPDELEKAVELAAAEVAPDGAVVILLDAEGDCPATLAPKLESRARRARSDLQVSVILARHEFESWYIAAARSLGLLIGSENPPLDPEAIQGAKEWLAKRLPHRKYSETVDQPALAARFELSEARRCPSFGKLWREMEGLVTARRQKPDESPETL